MKTHTTLSVEPYLIEKAKEKRLNLSRVFEEGIIHTLHEEVLNENSEKEHKDLFFINELGQVREVSREIYLRRKNSLFRIPIKKKKIEINKGNISLDDGNPPKQEIREPSI